MTGILAIFVLTSCFILVIVLTNSTQRTEFVRIALLALIAILLAIGASLAVDSGRELQKIDFAREVDARQVSLSGQSTFSAQIYIKYKEGKFYSAELMPKTTVPWNGKLKD